MSANILVYESCHITKYIFLMNQAKDVGERERKTPTIFGNQKFCATV